MRFFIFLFGAAMGSFLNVVALRYDPEQPLFGRGLLGRSQCPHCHHTLRWFELLPILSFLIQGGRCRRCRARISFPYPLIELTSGLLFLFVPLRLTGLSLDLYLRSVFLFVSALWILVFLLLLLMALIDLRLSIIPDEINLLLFIIGALIIFLSRSTFSIVRGSFLEEYAFLFGFRHTIWMNHLVLGALGAGFFFLMLILLTRGRGMGAGDLKLVIPLGLIFGWPDIIFIVGIAFVIGSLVSMLLILLHKKTMKSYLPFGPYLALSATVVFFFGHDLMKWYLHFFIA